MIHLLWLWPLIGIFCAFASTPKWMFKQNAVLYGIAFVCGAVVGPLGLVWFTIDNGSRG